MVIVNGVSKNLLQEGKTPILRGGMACRQVRLHVATVLVAFIALQIAPRAGRARVEGGAAVHAVGKALGVDLREVGGAVAAVIDAADAFETPGRARDMVNCVVQVGAVRVVGWSWTVC